ncbi:MAG: hypothetical protein GF311_01195 [Candidatus Lokiarchaeota archaeon]|nr:hypothetical protein [Candidatus Lokiarchaeota archaeon]
MIELQFLYYLLAVVIGIQLSFYFFYQYYKIKDVNLKLNRILVSFGNFILFMVFGALNIQIARNFIGDPFWKDIIYRLGWSLAFFSPIALEIFILTEEFGRIVNLRIIYILILLNGLAIVFGIIAPSTRSPIFFIAISFVILNGINVLRFEIILIKKSVGKIRKKFLLFFIGTITSLLALIFAVLVGLGVFENIFLEQIIYYIGVTILLIGFITIIFSVIDFPPFYEFEWRDNLVHLYIINRETYRSIYSNNFDKITQKQIPKNSQLNDKLVSTGLVGIDIIMSKITGTEEKKIHKIKHQDSYILLEYGSEPFDIIYALIIKKDLVSLTHFLQNIKYQFESFYREILFQLNRFEKNQQLLFGSFDVIVESLMR